VLEAGGDFVEELGGGDDYGQGTGVAWGYD
jgi:hypothetical protein